jgi:hypothetical protein
MRASLVVHHAWNKKKKEKETQTRKPREAHMHMPTIFLFFIWWSSVFWTKSVLWKTKGMENGYVAN